MSIGVVDASHSNYRCDEWDEAPYGAVIPEESTMIVEYIRYTIEASRQEEFAAGYENAAKCLRDSPHCLGYELSQCTEARESYILRILWDSADGHLKGFRTSAEFKPFFAAIQPFVKDIAEMRHYERTPTRWTRAGTEM